jgi:hypothetical protein
LAIIIRADAPRGAAALQSYRFMEALAVTAPSTFRPHQRDFVMLAVNGMTSCRSARPAFSVTRQTIA